MYQLRAGTPDAYPSDGGWMQSSVTNASESSTQAGSDDGLADLLAGGDLVVEREKERSGSALYDIHASVAGW